MTDITYSRIEVNASRLKCLLQAQWGQARVVEIRVVNGESAWFGESPSSEISAPADVELCKKLIQLVKDQPFLYDKTLENYKDETKKTETWNAIAECLNLSAEEAQIRWLRLRVDFGRHRRKRQAAEECGSLIRNWPLYGLLTWLAPHIKMRAKRKKQKHDDISKPHTPGYKAILPRPNWLVNDDDGVSVEVNPSVVFQNGHEDFTESFIVSPDTADYDDETSQENWQHPHEGKAAISGQELSYSSNSYTAGSYTEPIPCFEDENEDNLFCRSICASMRRFTHQQKALAKIRIQQVMYEVEFDQAEAANQVQN